MTEQPSFYDVAKAFRDRFHWRKLRRRRSCANCRHSSPRLTLNYACSAVRNGILMQTWGNRVCSKHVYKE